MSVVFAHNCIFFLFEASDMLGYRQKLILMADSSELGWKVANEYETNPLAEDSDDERRIFKAEARAARKAKAERGKRTRGRIAPYNRGARGAAGPSRPQYPARPPVVQAKPGVCFACGKQGHWKNECPGNNSNNKMSIPDIVMCIGPCIQKIDASGSDKNEISHTALNIDENKDSLSGEALLMGKESPVGRLKNHVSKWKEVTSDSYILDVVQTGYKLPFKTLPDCIVLGNNKSARSNPGFVEEEIDRLLTKGVVQEVQGCPQVVNPLTVAFSRSGKPRLVLDCRHINPHLHLFKVKFEDIREAEALFLPGSFVFTYDLKSAYHHIDIYKEHRTFLGFSWESDGKRKYYVFCSLPFGISTAGHIFTKVLRVVVTHVRANGHKVLMFLDDGLGGAASYNESLDSSLFCKRAILEFGFLLAHDKCTWEPTQVAIWLGYLLNFKINRIFIKEDRIVRLEHSLDKLIGMIIKGDYPLVPARFLASVIGQIISLQFVIGSKVRMLTRYMYNCVLSRASWNAPVLVTEKAAEEVKSWRSNLRSLNEKGRQFSDVSVTHYSVFCDASASGYGGYLESCALPVSDAANEQLELFYGVEGVVESTINAKESLGNGKKGLPEVSNGKKGLPEVSNGKKGLPEVSSRQNSSRGKVDECLSDMRQLCHGTVRKDGLVKKGTQNSFDNNNVQNSSLIGKPQDHRVLLPVASYIDTSVDNGQNKRLFDSEVVGSWTDSESSKSSTWRETEAVRRVIKSNADTLANKNVKVYSDNKNTTSVILHGSRCHDIHEVASDIAAICDNSNISMVTQWLPRVENTDADLLSRCGDSDDWSISPSWFSYLDSVWGKHTIDRFSSSYNNHCDRFNSRWWVPGTEGVDAFGQSWANEINWIVPPPRLIINCIRKMETDHAIGTLVVPKWKSAAFWPCLVDANNLFRKFVVDKKLLPKQGLIHVGKGNNGVFGIDPLPFNMMAIRINFYK